MPASLYRDHFQRADTAASYVDTYGGSTYDALLWEIEREQIQELLGLHARTDGVAVDCATGTGRVLSVLEAIFPRAVGIDSSLPMLEHARRRCTRAELIHSDLLDGLPMLAGEPVRVITAFRLLLNIDPDLRTTALRHFHAVLSASPGAVLLINNHGNTPSIKSIRASRSRGSYATEGNVLADTELRGLFRDTGWEIVDVRGSGLVGGRIARAVRPRLTAAVERRAAERARTARFGINQLYVLRPVVSA
jgi:hypothetical protein